MHIFLQENPKVSVGDANDDPLTIPTPEQLGSLLLTYSATGATDQSAAVYAALAIAAIPRWVPITATGATGATGAPDLISFTLGRSLRQGVELPTGTRPLASSVQLGTIAFATDTQYVGMAIPHPYDPTKQIWRAFISQRQMVVMAPGGVGVTTGRGGFYDSTTGVFTQATAIGQFCNAYSSTTAVAGAPVLISSQLYLLNLQNTANVTIGAEFMIDATGANIIPYVNNGTNIPLGIYGSEGSSLAGGFPSGLLYDW